MQMSVTTVGKGFSGGAKVSKKQDSLPLLTVPVLGCMEFHDLYFHTELLAFNHQPAVVHCAGARERERRFWWQQPELSLVCHKGSFTLILLHLLTVTVTAPPLRASYSRCYKKQPVCLSAFFYTIMITLSCTEDPISCQPASLPWREEWTGGDANRDVDGGKICSPRFSPGFRTVPPDTDCDWYSQQMTNDSTSRVKTWRTLTKVLQQFFSGWRFLCYAAASFGPLASHSGSLL